MNEEANRNIKMSAEITNVCSQLESNILVDFDTDIIASLITDKSIDLDVAIFETESNQIKDQNQIYSQGLKLDEVQENVGSADNINAKSSMCDKISDSDSLNEESIILDLDTDIIPSTVTDDALELEAAILERNFAQNQTNPANLSNSLAGEQCINAVNKTDYDNTSTGQIDMAPKIPDTSSNNNILQLNTDVIQSLISDDFMDLDVADLEVNGSNESIDLSQTDIESLLKANYIVRNEKSDETCIEEGSEIDKENINNREMTQLHFVSPTDSINGIADLSATVEERNTVAKDNPMILLHSDPECDDDDYHSSDFEFITESEAELEGLITNKTYNNPKTSKSKLDFSTNKKSLDSSKTNDTVAPGPSRDTKQYVVPDTSKYWSRSYNRGLILTQYKKDLKSHRETHQIPQGDAYINLFQGGYSTTSMFLENKSVILPACMTVQDAGFYNDIAGYKHVSVDKQYLKEAEENVMKILEKYPRENRKKRLRY